MKKSTLLYIGAATAFSMGLIWAAFAMLNGQALLLWSNKILPFLPFFNGLYGFVFVFIATFLVKNANRFYNLERGRSANATMPTTRAWTIVNVTGIGLCVLLGLVFLIRYMVNGNNSI